MSAAEGSNAANATGTSTVIDGSRSEFPVLKATLGPDVTDIGALNARAHSLHLTSVSVSLDASV